MQDKRSFLSVGLVLLVALLITSLSTNTVYSAGRPTRQPTATSGPTRTPTITRTPTSTRTPIATATQVSPCATSTPPSGTYSITLCFTTPAAGSKLTGAATVSVTVTITGTSPGIQRVVFYLNGAYLLTDYEAPYTFQLPTTKWQDGVYNLQVEALMRDAYTTANQAVVSLTFNNGIKNPPHNNLTFTPKTGTTPPPGSPFIVAAAGDGASGETSSANVTSLISTINPNLFLYLGDVYENGSVSEFYNWYGNGGTNFSQFLSITDPTIGNHEYTAGAAPGYFDYWDNIPDYYSFNAGGWHIVSLNANAPDIGVTAGSPQYNWLSQDLSANANACTIVYYHQPLFNIGPEGATTAMADIWALMAQKGVSIVLNGHDHDYQRWEPLDGNGNPSPTGITEFVAGGAGHGLQTIIGSDPRVVFSDDLNPQTFGALRLALNANGASFSYINSSGVVLDSGVVPCDKAGVDTQAPTVPASVTATAASATQVNLGWHASNDNVGVNGYTIYRNSAFLATVSGSTLTYTDATTLPSASYSYTVDAFDLAGNHSNQSTPANVTTPPMPSSLTFTTQADTYVNASSPGSTYGAGTAWRVDGTPDLHAYLKFTVQGLAGTPIQHAYLKVYANTTSSNTINAVGVVDNTWNENTVTYNTAPPLGAVLGSSGASVAGTWLSVDVTAYVTGEGTYSFGVTTPGTSTLSFASKESGSNAAQLVILLSDTQPPSIPAGLTATAAGVTQVNLAWQASTDDIGVAGYTVYRDGAVLGTVSGATLTYTDNTAHPSTTYSYTVDAFDQAGNHSNQSTAGNVTTPALPSSLTFTTLADTYVSASNPNTNYGASTAWRVDGSPDLHAYLKFTVQGLAGMPVLRAFLKVYANSSSASGINTLAVADDTWGETAVTYNTAPPLGAVIGSYGAYSAGSWVQIDVTSYVTGEGTYSFGITTPGSTTLSFASKESGANAAQLVIVLSDTQAPSIPSGVTATAAGATQVNLAWQASTDDVGVAGYTIYRDNTVLTTVSGTTLTYTDNTAQPSTTYSYTVDAFDQAGNHSDQSTPASVTTPALPTSLTFTTVADTYVNSGSPDSNYGTSTALRVDGSPDLHALLKFTLQGFSGQPVVHAYLRVYANTSSTAGINVVAVGDNTWSESTVTYNTAPALGAVLGSNGAYAAGAWITIDVTSYITGEGTYSFGITTPGSTTLSFASKESGANAAQLLIFFQ